MASDTPALLPQFQAQIPPEQSLADALASAQAEFPRLGSDSVGKVQSDKANYEFPYASLASLLEALRPVLNKHGFAVVQGAEPVGDSSALMRIYTILQHRLGSYSASIVLPLGNGFDPKKVGATMTYGRRYTFAAVTGTAAYGDDDLDQTTGASTPKAKSRPAPRQAPPAATHSNAGGKITDKQLKRFWAIARNAGRDDEAIKDYLFGCFGVTHSRDILVKDYEAICKAVEAPGALPAGDREPGAEG